MKPNPSKRPSKHQTEHILIDTHICQACWECVKACPKGVLGKINILASTNTPSPGMQPTASAASSV